MRYMTLILAAGLSLAASDLTGQTAKGEIELGLFGDYTRFGERAGCPCMWPANSVGFGGRTSYGVADNVYLEADLSYARPERIVAGGNMSYLAMRSTINAYLLIDEVWGVSFTSGIGPMIAIAEDVGTRFGGAITSSVRYRVMDALVLSAGATGDYIPGENNVNVTMRTGASYVGGGKEPSIVPIPPAVQTAPVMSQRVENALESPAGQVAEEVLNAPVYFDFDDSRIRVDAAATLDEKVAWLRANPQLRLEISGHADERGTINYNVPLGLARSNSVVEYLVASGLPRRRFDVISLGDSALRCASIMEGDGCHALNRRVEFTVLAAQGVIRPPQQTARR